MEEISLSNALFSKVQQRVLALIFGHPERSFYTSEIVRSVHSGTGAVERELSRLQRSGLVSVERIGNRKHYGANRQSPIFEELHRLILKTIGLRGAAEGLACSLCGQDQDRVRVWIGRQGLGPGAKRHRLDGDRRRPRLLRLVRRTA